MNSQHAFRINALKNTLSQRIVMLDGGMGTMIQAKGLKGCNDWLCITNPLDIKEIHSAYLQAGSDIIETNSFNCNAISLRDYALEDKAQEIARAAASVARKAVQEWEETHPGDMRWVAGSVGPTNRSLSMSPDVNDPAARNITWNELVAAYDDQITGLILGGVDLLLFETCYDTLNVKAAVFAAHEVQARLGTQLPLMLSITLTESGRLLSGQTVEALLASVANTEFLSIGLNCGFGAQGMVRHLEQMAAINQCLQSVYPNAGLPNEMGEYDESPENMAKFVRPMLENGLVNILGGCCGTTPSHIIHLASLARQFKPRTVPAFEQKMQLAGLEALSVVKERNFVNIGERCNVAGSRKFLRLIKEKNYAEAVQIAANQVNSGAQIIDVNMDDGLLDAPTEMAHFLRLIAAEPSIAKVPVMIDSSNWDVIVPALQTQQGKCIVNSISLKDGEEKFIAKAQHIKRMGAAAVVMAFDENGQAETFERKITVCARAYEILTQKVDFNPCDIVFDPNILAVATGIEAHNRYAIDFINAVEWIKTNLPGAKVSGGVSNLSFSFRGNNFVREAMHSAFLYHAIARGMDMAIVNAGAIMPYADIPTDLRTAIEDVLFDKHPQATDNLIAIAETLKDVKASAAALPADELLSLPPIQRLEAMIERGITENLEETLALVHEELGSAIEVINQPLMSGINRVGKLFGEGKLFLPQVVKSARTMKQAVAWLNPLIAEEKHGEAHSSGRIVIATVKGDVHDIGKNIVSVVLRCNGFDVIDLGVMVPGEEIIAKAKETNADIIALSGLITPSLEEMRKVAAMMQKEGMTIPLMVGGATTSEIHTAVRIAPEYSGLVLHTRDAAIMPVMAHKALRNTGDFAHQVHEQQEILRQKHMNQQQDASAAALRAKRLRLDFHPVPPRNGALQQITINVNELRPLINWSAFMAAWKLDARFGDISAVMGCDCNKAVWLAQKPVDERQKASEAMQLYKEANRALDRFEREAKDSPRALFGIWEANSDDNDNIIINHNITIHTSRRDRGECSVALSDYVAPANTGITDYVGAFACTAGSGIKKLIDEAKAEGNDYRTILYQTLADRIAEAATEFTHAKVRNNYWGYTYDDPLIDNPQSLLRQYYKGIRPAIGYPSLPDQAQMHTMAKLLPFAQIGVSVTENGALSPAASTCGIFIAHPDSKY